MSDQRIEADIGIEAPTEKVWEAWVDPVRLAGWFVDEARGRIDEDDEVAWVWEQLGEEMPYRVVTVDPGRRFVLEAAPDIGPTRTIAVELTATDEGATRVRLEESGFDDDPESVRSGWQMALGLLKVHTEHYYGRDVRSVMVMAKVEAVPDEILALQRTEDGLAQWLTADGALPEEGGPVRLELQDGVVVDGRVLRRTATETSLTWPWIQGVLELKQFMVGPDRAAAFRAFTWTDEIELDLEELQEVLTGALERFLDALE